MLAICRIKVVYSCAAIRTDDSKSLYQKAIVINLLCTWAFQTLPRIKAGINTLELRYLTYLSGCVKKTSKSWFPYCLWSTWPLGHYTKPYYFLLQDCGDIRGWYFLSSLLILLDANFLVGNQQENRRRGVQRKVIRAVKNEGKYINYIYICIYD